MVITRTLFIHSSIHWPKMSDPTMWPMVVRQAVWIYNHTPNPETGLAPIDTWSKTKFLMIKLQNLHVFGSPVYVLDKQVADGKSIRHWEPKSHCRIYMGMSSKHNYDVPLVLNLDTGYIKPQWNVVFDNWFTTVLSKSDEVPDFTFNKWLQLFTDNTYHFPHDNPSDELEEEDLGANVYRQARQQAIATSVAAPQQSTTTSSLTTSTPIVTSSNAQAPVLPSMAPAVASTPQATPTSVTPINSAPTTPIYRPSHHTRNVEVLKSYRPSHHTRNVEVLKPYRPTPTPTAITPIASTTAKVPTSSPKRSQDNWSVVEGRPKPA